MVILWITSAPGVAANENSVDLTERFSQTLMQAMAGDAEAQNRIGVFYETGIGTRPDFNEARRWYSRAMEQGNSAAISNLASIYIDGRGVPVDFEKGAELMKKAAKQGYPAAIGKLGFAYVTGQGVPFDNPKGLRMLREAADADDGFAAFHLGLAYYFGTYGEEKESAQALSWLKKSAELGFPDGQQVYGGFFRSGKLGIAPDIEQYMKWNYLAANGGNTHAQFLLGQAFEYGEAGAPSSGEAERWYRVAAENGHPLANQALYKMGLNGADGLPPLRPGNDDLVRLTQMLSEKVTVEGVVMTIFALGLAIEYIAPPSAPGTPSYATPPPDCWWPMKSNGFTCVPDLDVWLD